ncbi:uncharacterized protein PpBr36_10763 [Pyricularia pennisetigena]|uniref:uncharacterized protein n=1 Tax=Pyricularia pennisetigena TaxID=1578925 RepID=UPI0011524B44|nr:uncharacterized protein PpBr36_10763 [Pyricularia pennisetigena]TLS21021.1 hypothetical protein PpBr36_10763 [Pyricularia pennisetigena]
MQFGTIVTAFALLALGVNGNEQTAADFRLAPRGEDWLNHDYDPREPVNPNNEIVPGNTLPWNFCRVDISSSGAPITLPIYLKPYQPGRFQTAYFKLTVKPNGDCTKVSAIHLEGDVGSRWSLQVHKVRA